MLFNNDWTFYKQGKEEEKKIISLPYDAMLSEKRPVFRI